MAEPVPSEFWEVRHDPVLGYEPYSRPSPDHPQTIGVGVRFANREDAAKVGRLLGRERLKQWKTARVRV